VTAVADEFDIAWNLLDSILIVLGEIASDTKQSRIAPVNRLLHFGAKALQHQHLEVFAVVHKPIEIEQPLIDDVLIQGALVFQDDRTPVFVNAERIYTAAVHLASAVLGSEKAHAQQRFEMALDEQLECLLDGHRAPR
jgi:hypothetical protein